MHSRLRQVQAKSGLSRYLNRGLRGIAGGLPLTQEFVKLARDDRNQCERVWLRQGACEGKRFFAAPARAFRISAAPKHPRRERQHHRPRISSEIARMTAGYIGRLELLFDRFLRSRKIAKQEQRVAQRETRLGHHTGIAYGLRQSDDLPRST